MRILVEAFNEWYKIRAEIFILYFYLKKTKTSNSMDGSEFHFAMHV